MWANILPTLSRQADFIQNFCAARRSAAAVGAASVSDAIIIDRDPEEEAEGQPQGLGNTSAE